MALWMFSDNNMRDFDPVGFINKLLVFGGPIVRKMLFGYYFVMCC